MKWLFWDSVLVLFYTYLGYPAWLWLRSHFRFRPVRPSDYTPSLSIVMIVRNEAPILEAKLRNISLLDYPEEKLEIIVVSDGSSDASADILQRYAAVDSRMKILLHPHARGKAAGLTDAIALSAGEIVLFTDARQKIESDAVRLLTANFADAEVGCASGELMLGDPSSGEVSHGVGLYWRMEKYIREMESRSGSVVGATGAIYAVRRNLLVPVPPGTILDDVYIPMHVVRQGFRVIFVPTARAWDIAEQERKQEFARKVRTLGGNYQLLQIAPWLLGHSNPLRFEFISHKLLRLFAPFALLGAFLAALVLAQPIYRLALVLQLAFYSLSGIAALKLARGPLAHIADAASTFVVLNTAAVVAFVKFVTGRPVAWVR